MSRREVPNAQPIAPKTDAFKAQYRPTASGKTVDVPATSTLAKSPQVLGVKQNPSKDDVLKNPQFYVDIMADDDQDGLTNPWEVRYGTDHKKSDTDNDGLTDYEEVMIYFSNPKVADTDGDGNADGIEVKNGFNPNGEGKLKSASIKR